MRLTIGISIILIAFTSQCCDRFMMQWFPYWHRSFFFMGCTFVFFCCTPWVIETIDDTEDGYIQLQIILEFITFCTGILYLLLGTLEFFGCCNCNKPTHLMSSCAGGRSGGKSKTNSKKRKKSAGGNKKSGLKSKKTK